MAVFRAFKPEAMNKIAQSMGYSGDMREFESFIEQDPARKARMNQFTNAAMQMARGGVVKLQAGGDLQKQIEEAQKQVDASRSINYRGSSINIAGGPSMTDSKSGTNYQGFYDAGGRFRKFNQHPDVLAADQAYRSATANLTNLQKQYADMQKQAASQPQQPPPQLVDPRQPPSGGLIGNNIDRTDYSERGFLGSQIGSVGPGGTGGMQAAQQSISNLPGGFLSEGPEFYTPQQGETLLRNTPTPFNAYTAVMPRTGGEYAYKPDGSRVTVKQGYFDPRPQAPGGEFVGSFDKPLDYYLPGAYPPGVTPEINPKYKETPPPLALTGGQPGGATPVMNDPRGGLQVGGNMAGPGLPLVNLLTGEMAPPPDYSGMTFEQAQSRLRQMDMKSPAEQAAIDAAIARGPSTAQQDTPPAAPTPQSDVKNVAIGDVTTQRMYAPGLPQGGVTTAAMTPTGPGQEVQQGTGALTGAVAVPTAMAQTAMVSPQQETQANLMTATTAAPAINAALQTVQAAQVQPDDVRAQVAAAQQTASSVGNLTAAQGNATLIDNPVQRNIQSGELISGVANAQVASSFTEQVQAATATPSTQATVQGQLAQLTANFDASNPPAWAAGALRGVQAQMAARGLGASSIAGQAMVQAALESAIPIAQADASVTAQFETQNLSNRQQRAMLSAQQRAQFIGQEFDQAFQARVQNAAKISDIANQNFTAEQQVQLENSRAANTMNLNNLSNKQALVIAEASALTQMDLSNLNNRQQSAVQNASNFLQRDMANLSNSQQTELFNAQQRVQSLFTDAAAANAASQFNASSQNQVDQFFANLGLQTSQFNATQSNAQSQFNAGQANTVERFNAEMNNQRDQFNAQNQLVIAQSNAQWRRQLATADTATINRVNEINAQNVLDISKTAYDNLWQYYGDTMEWAWKSAENEIDRISALAIAELDAKTQEAVSARQAASSSGKAIGSLIGTLGSAWIGGL